MREGVDVFIARQAILDREQKLYGYELLFRPCRQEHAGVIDDSASTLQVLSTALLSAGFHQLRPGNAHHKLDVLVSLVLGCHRDSRIRKGGAGTHIRMHETQEGRLLACPR